MHDSTPARPNREERTAAVKAYNVHLGFDRTPAPAAVLQLATTIAQAMGTGHTDPEGETDGILDVPVVVTEHGVFGDRHAVTLWEDGQAVVVLDDDPLPVEQLIALLEQIQRYCISRSVR